MRIDIAYVMRDNPFFCITVKGVDMNMPRYFITGAATLAIHAALLFVIPDNKAIAMPSGANTTSVSIKFLAPSQVQKKISPQESVSAVVPVPKAVEPKQHKQIVKNYLLITS